MGPEPDLPLDEATGNFGADEPSFNQEPPTQRWLQRGDFSRRVARDWEAAFFAADTPRTRKVVLRSAVVLGPAPGSAFAVLSIIMWYVLIKIVKLVLVISTLVTVTILLLVANVNVNISMLPLTVLINLALLLNVFPTMIL